MRIGCGAREGQDTRAGDLYRHGEESRSSRVEDAVRSQGSQERVVVGAIIAGALCATLAACADAGDLSIVNNSSTDVTVRAGGDEADETVSAWGGVVFLDYGCTPGDVTVEFPSGRSVVVPGPVCPDQTIVIDDGTVELEPTA